MAPTRSATQLVNQDGDVVKAATPKVFGDVALTAPDDPRIYDNKGSLSTKVADFSVPIYVLGGERLTIATAAYGGLTKEGRLSIRVSLPMKVKASKEFRDDFKRHINIALIQWPMYPKVCRAALALLKNPPKPKARAESKADDVTADDLTWDDSASEPVATTA